MFDVVTILVVDLLCSLQTAHGIYQLPCAKSVGEIVTEYFGIKQLPCYAQFKSILASVRKLPYHRAKRKRRLVGVWRDEFTKLFTDGSIGNVKADSMDSIFIKWRKMAVQNQLMDKTFAINGKTVCTTRNM